MWPSLLDGFGPEDSPSPGLFRLAVTVLRALPEATDPETVLRYFEFHLLRLNGMLPELYQCVECRQEVQPDAHRFSVNFGGVLCHECRPLEAQVRPLSLRAIKVLRLLHRGGLAEVSSLSVNSATVRGAEVGDERRSPVLAGQGKYDRSPSWN